MGTAKARRKRDRFDPKADAHARDQATGQITERDLKIQGMKGKRRGMQQLQEAVLSGTDRKRVEAVAETLANLASKGEGVAELMHDARNMVTALGLYCDLLEEPGVLTTPFLHYGRELKQVAAASR